MATSDERSNFTKSGRVEQDVNALSGSKPALRMLPGYILVPAHRLSETLALI
jgi:hypothetical protein